VLDILTYPASTPGPMARSPLDCALLLQSMMKGTNNHKLDISSVQQTSKKELKHKNKLRIGWLGDWNHQLPMEDGIVSTCHDALQCWGQKSLGYDIEIVTKLPNLFDMELLWETYNTIRFASTYEAYSQKWDMDDLLNDKKHLMKEELAWELEQGRFIMKENNEETFERIRDMYDEYIQWLDSTFSSDTNEGGLDILALPTAQVWPFPIKERYPKIIEKTHMDTYHRWMQVCIPVSLGGLPCTNIPAGFGGANQMPMGIQLFAKRDKDLDLLKIAIDYHQVYTPKLRKRHFTFQDIS